MYRADPGSFRDPASHIVFSDGRVVRLLDERGLAGWEALAATETIGPVVAGTWSTSLDAQ